MSNPMTNVELGKHMLELVGEAACLEGYGTTDPYWVGYYAIYYGDIDYAIYYGDIDYAIYYGDIDYDGTVN